MGLVVFQKLLDRFLLQTHFPVCFFFGRSGRAFKCLKQVPFLREERFSEKRLTDEVPPDRFLTLERYFLFKNIFIILLFRHRAPHSIFSGRGERGGGTKKAPQKLLEKCFIETHSSRKKTVVPRPTKKKFQIKIFFRRKQLEKERLFRFIQPPTTIFIR